MSQTLHGGFSGKGIGFQRVRRLGGWLSRSLDTWNDAMLAELADRSPHSLEGIYPRAVPGVADSASEQAALKIEKGAGT